MSDLLDGQPEPMFVVFTGTPTVTVAQVNAALKSYAVVNWNWAVCDGMVVLSALMCSLKEIRAQQLAAARLAQTPNWRPN